ncbi:MAG TPA: hypothetical protein VE650_04595, partial [Acetobacteraceae bacterium]|nr:hypothetical protein [Acetobacteraceae bacterium]
RFPSMRTEVLHVNGGNLVPGHSGAALIDWQGKVLGIGSGGLASGSAGIGWAVRATYLNALPDAATTIPPLGTKAAAAFAVAMPSRGAGDSVTCGALPLFRTRQSTLGEIARTSDDPDRIEGLASEIGGVPFEALKAVRATIWVERQSGAAIVVPEGATLSAGDPFCAVTTADPDVSMLVRLDPLPMQEGTVEWDVEKFKLQNRSHRLVRSVSDSRIVYRGHGLVSGVHLVNGAEVLRRLGEATPPDGRRVRIYRADMAGRGAAVVVAAIAHDLKPASAGARGMPWAASVLAVHLSSFPPRLRETQGQGTEPAARAYKRIRCGEGELSPLGQAGPPPEPDPQIAALQRTAFGGELPRTRAAVAWTSPRWGFQIYLPEGVEPKPDDDACVFASRDPALRYAIRLAQQPGGDQLRKARDAETEEFRARLARLSGAPLREIASSTGDTSAPRGATYAVLQGELPGAGRVLALLADLRPNFGMPRYLQALVGAVYIEPNPAGERPTAYANAVRDLMASSAPPR